MPLILCVDRDPNTLDLLVKTLSDITNGYGDCYDYTVKTATRAKDALSYTPAPSLIITDPELPDSAGFGFIRALRLNTLTSTVPIIVLSKRSSEYELVLFLFNM